MCKIYNTTGSLSAIKSHLQLHGITEFNSLNELIAFQKKYLSNKAELIVNHELLIEHEKTILHREISELESVIKARKTAVENQLRIEIAELMQQLRHLKQSSTNIIKRFINHFKMSYIKNLIRINELNFTDKVSASIDYLKSNLLKMKNRYEFINSNFTDAVSESSFNQLKTFERKSRVVDEISNYIYGAIGEQKVVKELEKLPDGYYLINDLSLTFNPPMYNKQENDYIKSIQIDHVLISPSGIFIIETKNCSEQSLKSLSLRSPIQQIKRFNFALFILINEAITRGNLNIDQHHWGERRIPIRNIIVLINSKPKEEFQYVKILTLNELLGYVKYFEDRFSNEEANKITNYLLNCDVRRY